MKTEFFPKPKNLFGFKPTRSGRPCRLYQSGVSAQRQIMQV